MRRRLFNAAVILSLGLAILLFGVWLRGVWVVDQLTWWDGKRDGWLLLNAHGMLGIGHLGSGSPRGLIPNTADVARGWAWERDPVNGGGGAVSGRKAPSGRATPLPPTFNHLRIYRGFGFASFTGLPLWVGCLLTLVLPGVWVLRRLDERRRARQGQCRVCGYDLRGSPGACPECGAARPVTV